MAQAKEICNRMCAERGLSIAAKGRHADGSAFLEGEVSTWSKNKWHQMANDPKQSYLLDLAAAVQNSMDTATSRESFIRQMELEHGWSVTWRDSKKNIVFTNADGKRVRDSNLNKTFHMDISKEALSRHFEQRRNQQKKESGRKR